MSDEVHNNVLGVIFYFLFLFTILNGPIVSILSEWMMSPNKVFSG